MASTRSRKLKTELMAGLISRSNEPGVLVTLLAGEPRQAKIGVGYASAYGVQVGPADKTADEADTVDAVRAIFER